ncbi:MAG: tetratricopeptide repeat protein [Nitrospirae bacterium]|nr:tetratricopeptide repeat protein [Nitrospirota bacterium]
MVLTYTAERRKAMYLRIICTLICLVVNLSWHTGHKNYIAFGVAYAENAINEALEHNNRGVVWVRKLYYDRAIDEYTKAIEINPRFTDAYYNRGAAWAGKGDRDRAIADFTKAAQLGDKEAQNILRKAGIKW